MYLSVNTKLGQNVFDHTISHDFDYFIEHHWLVISVYLSSQPVAHMSYASTRRSVVTGNSARIQDETTESSACFIAVLGV